MAICYKVLNIEYLIWGTTSCRPKHSDHCCVPPVLFWLFNSNDLGPKPFRLRSSQCPVALPKQSHRSQTAVQPYWHWHSPELLTAWHPSCPLSPINKERWALSAGPSWINWASAEPCFLEKTLPLQQLVLLNIIFLLLKWHTTTQSCVETSFSLTIMGPSQNPRAESGFSSAKRGQQLNPPLWEKIFFSWITDSGVPAATHSHSLTGTAEPLRLGPSSICSGAPCAA
jgi:hypothetical protein